MRAVQGGRHARNAQAVQDRQGRARRHPLRRRGRGSGPCRRRSPRLRGRRHAAGQGARARDAGEPLLRRRRRQDAVHHGRRRSTRSRPASTGAKPPAPAAPKTPWRITHVYAALCSRRWWRISRPPPPARHAEYAPSRPATSLGVVAAARRGGRAPGGPVLLGEGPVGRATRRALAPVLHDPQREALAPDRVPQLRRLEGRKRRGAARADDVSDGYYCAPQVFWFEPHQRWYMILQVSDPARPVALSRRSRPPKPSPTRRRGRSPHCCTRMPTPRPSAPGSTSGASATIASSPLLHLQQRPRCRGASRSSPTSRTAGRTRRSSSAATSSRPSCTYKLQGTNQYLSIVEAETRRPGGVAATTRPTSPTRSTASGSLWRTRGTSRSPGPST